MMIKIHSNESVSGIEHADKLEERRLNLNIIYLSFEKFRHLHMNIVRYCFTDGSSLHLWSHNRKFLSPLKLKVVMVWYVFVYRPAFYKTSSMKAKGWSYFLLNKQDLAPCFACRFRTDTTGKTHAEPDIPMLRSYNGTCTNESHYYDNNVMKSR